MKEDFAAMESGLSELRDACIAAAGGFDALSRELALLLRRLLAELSIPERWAFWFLVFIGVPKLDAIECIRDTFPHWMQEAAGSAGRDR